MTALERAARAIVDKLPPTVGVESGGIMVDIADLQALRRALALTATQTAATIGDPWVLGNATRTNWP